MTAPELMTTNQTSDRVFLRELAVECIIGFLDWERLVKQTVYLDIEVPVDCRRAALTDDPWFDSPQWHAAAVRPSLLRSNR